MCCFNGLKGRVDGVEVPSETNAVTSVSGMRCMGLPCDFEGQHFAANNLFGPWKQLWEIADFSVRKWNVCSASPRAWFESQRDF
jgi:hypothetical protein